MIKRLLQLGLLSLFSGIVCAQGLLDRLEQPRPAPAFELPGIDGKTYRLADFRGRYLLVNFWAVWCPPCRQEMPSMQGAYQELKSPRFDMLAIHVGPSREDADKFAKGQLLHFPIVVDEHMDLGGWQVEGLPTTFLVDPKGMIIASAIGEREWDSEEMLAQLQALMAAEPAVADGR
ncbi:TlpA family protein disulfide reductase [Thiosocius teredinicola]|uniref:TlpA family protein disulfide reductase n=1 Tax=Thiosocius teredinicola TaxID=1973002 RepID=UPI0013DE0E6D